MTLSRMRGLGSAFLQKIPSPWPMLSKRSGKCLPQRGVVWGVPRGSTRNANSMCGFWRNEWRQCCAKRQIPRGDMIAVYKLDASMLGGGERRFELPPDCRLVAWEPSLLRGIPDHIGFEKIGFIKNWIFHSPRFLSGRRLYSVYSLMAGAHVLSQCILTPGSSRYRFMAAEDMQ